MPARKTKKLNLALQGGGAHGAFTWGVLDYLLEDKRIDIEAISGTSIGAINACLVADGFCDHDRDAARERLEQFWMKFSDLALFSPIQRTPFARFMGDWSLDWSPSRMAFDAFTGTWSPYEFNPLNMNPLLDLLESEIDFDKVSRCPNLQVFISATNVMTGKIKVFRGDEITAKSVMASSCLPEIYQAVEVDGEHYWDGGFMGNPPLYPLFYNTKCEDVLLVQINPVEIEELPTTVRSIHNRLNEINFNATLMRELRMVEFVTRLIDDGKLDPKEYMRARMHAIEPAQEMSELSSSSKLNLEWAFLQHLKSLGRQSAENWLEANFDDIGKKSTLDMRAMFE